MARWLTKSGTSVANVFTYQPALTPGGGFQFNGAGGVDTLKVVLTAGEWASAAVQREFAAFANFLNNATKNARGEITGTFTFGTLNIQAQNIEKLQLVVAGKVVNPLNDAPVVNRAIANKTISEDSGAFTYKLPANAFTDVDSPTLKYSATLSDGSALPAWLQFNAATKTFSGTPPTNFNGSFNVKVTASDGKLTASDVFELNVTPVNDAPVAVFSSAVHLDEDNGLPIVAPGVLFDDIDVDGDALTAILVEGPSHGTLTLSPTGAFIYIPDENYFGPDSFKYKANDGQADSNISTFDLVINSVNDRPVVTRNETSLPFVNSLGVGRANGLSLAQTFTAEGTLPNALSILLTENPSGVIIRVFEVSGNTLGTLLATSVQISGTGIKSIDLSALDFVEGATYAWVVSGTDYKIGPALNAYTGGTVAFNDSTVATVVTALTPNAGDLAFNLTYDDEAHFSVDTGDTYRLQLSDLRFTDVDTLNAEIRFVVSDTPDHGSFERRIGGIGTGTPVGDFTYAQVEDGEIFYKHVGSPGAEDAFKIRVFDGVDLSSASTPIDGVITIRGDDTDGFLNDLFYTEMQTLGGDATGGSTFVYPTGASGVFTDDQVKVTVFGAGGTFGAGAFWLIQDRYGQLDPITGVILSATNNMQQLTQADVTVVDENTVTVNLEGTFSGSAPSFTLDFLFA